MPRTKKTQGLTGNDKLDQDLAKLPDMNNTEALNVALALQEIMRGQQSILANQETQGDALAKLKQRMDALDAEAEKFNKNKAKYLMEVEDRAAKLRVKGVKKDKLIAKGMEMAQKAIQNAKAENANEHLEFEKQLAAMPKVAVTSAGRIEMGVGPGGQQVSQLLPEEIRIKNKIWRLPIGMTVEVPQVVAERLLDLRKSQQETLKIQQAHQSNLEHPQLVQKLNEIGKEKGNSRPLIAGQVEEI